MAAVAHASPADFRRLALVRTPPVLRRQPSTAVYRRRRAVAFVMAVAAGAALLLAVGGLLSSFGSGTLTAPERPSPPGQVYVVQPGDTFWAIATRLDPGGDPRPLVARMVAAHGSPVLVAGERLPLPRGA